jgi:hypothetical protein
VSRLGRIDHLHRRHKAIAPAQHRGNVPGHVRRIAQHLAQLAYGNAYHGVAHGGFGPDSI